MITIKNKKYWEFKNISEGEADLYLYTEIASWGYGYEAHSAKSFKNELDHLGNIEVLNIYINSPGGDVFEGISIYNMLKRHKAHVNVHVDGLAASIASVIAMAGDTVIMPKNSMMMIHHPWTYGIGNANDFEKLAEDLEKIGESIIESYIGKVGENIDRDTIVDLMDKETWLTAQECYDYGLADKVAEEKQIAASTSKELFNKYRNIPESLLTELNSKPGEPVRDEGLEILIARVNQTLKYEEELINE